MKIRASITCPAQIAASLALLALGGAFAAQAAQAATRAEARSDPITAAASRQRLAVPAYFGPGPFWRQMVQAHPPLQVAVMNPDSGPGTARDRGYATAIRAAQMAGIQVLGYVDTDYGHRALSAVKAEIGSYDRWYHVDGIFLDRASTKCSREPYYARIDRYIKSEGGPARTILNPGTQTHSCYEPAADVLLTFEGSASTYLHSYSAPKWVSRFPASHFWHVIYATPASSLAEVVKLSKRRHAGFVYVTSETLPNPYAGLPTGTYWSDELSEVDRPSRPRQS